MFLNAEFLKIYEELSVLNEAPMARPQVCIKDLVGYKDGRPILKSDYDTKHQKSLFDLGLIDIDGSKELNKGKTAVRTWDGGAKQKVISLELPEDENTWVLDSTTLSRNVKLRLKCSNPACRYGGTFITSIKAINERIWGIDDKGWGKYSNEQSIEDIALCGGCVKERTLSKKRAEQGEAELWGKHRMCEIGGFDENGQVIKADNLSNSLLPYLNIQASLELNPDLGSIDPKYWPAFDEKRTFYYNCPSCGLPDTKKGTSIRYKNAEAKTAVDLVKCRTCGNARRQTDENYGIPIVRDSEVWDRVADWMFDDKSLGEEATLTKAGYEFLLTHNKSTKSNKVFIRNLSLAFMDNDRPAKIKAAKHFTNESELVLPFVCNNKDCLARNNGKAHEYVSTPHLVNKGIYFGCDSCAGYGRNHSAAELALRDAIEILFNVKHKKTKKIKPYNDIDILFNYNGKMFGIEYDGQRYHQDPKTISADASKMTVFNKEQNIFFIRVREKECLEFSTNIEPAKVIKIDGWLLGLSKQKYLACLTQIGQIVTNDQNYVIPEGALTQLINLAKLSKAG